MDVYQDVLATLASPARSPREKLVYWLFHLVNDELRFNQYKKGSRPSQRGRRDRARHILFHMRPEERGDAMSGTLQHTPHPMLTQMSIDRDITSFYFDFRFGFWSKNFGRRTLVGQLGLETSKQNWRELPHRA